MKQNKMITLDPELIEKLKTVANASALIQILLVEYFKSAEPQTKEQKKLALAKLEAQYKYEQEIEKIDNNIKTD